MKSLELTAIADFPWFCLWIYIRQDLGKTFVLPTHRRLNGKIGRITVYWHDKSCIYIHFADHVEAEEIMSIVGTLNGIYEKKYKSARPADPVPSTSRLLTEIRRRYPNVYRFSEIDIERDGLRVWPLGGIAMRVKCTKDLSIFRGRENELAILYDYYCKSRAIKRLPQPIHMEILAYFLPDIIPK
jgi:hypothetical protein